MIIGVIFFSLAFVFLGGVAFGIQATGWAAVLTAIGAGWLGIIYSALYRRNQDVVK